MPNSAGTIAYFDAWMEKSKVSIYIIMKRGPVLDR